jgi:hypothetical protein
MSSVQQTGRAGVVQSSQAHLRGRIYGEFLEMPGMTLSLPQAARLFSVDRGELQHLLDALVAARLLRTDGRVYALAGAGRLCS